MRKHPSERLDRHLDASDVFVVADADLGKSQLLQCELGSLDRCQAAQRDTRAIGDTRSEARGRRFVPRCEAERLRCSAHGGLVEAGIDHRKPRTSLRGRGLARAMVAEIIEVHAEHDRRSELVGNRLNRVHERVLAVETPIAVVAAIRGILHLVGRDFFPLDAPRLGQAGAIVALGSGERRRHGSYGRCVVGSECVVCDPGEERRVDTSTERHNNPTDRTQLAPKVIECLHGNQSAQSVVKMCNEQ